MLFKSKGFIISLFLLLVAANTQSQNQLTNLPTLYLTTENAKSVWDKTTWVPGNVKVVASDESENLDMAMEIRGRGNSTWNMPKKPYRIKLDKKTRLLNLPAKEKNWVLLANYADKTLIRNAVAFKISELIGLEFSPSARFVDVVLNEELLGNYMLTDQVEVNEFRVPVQKLDTQDTSMPTMSGGYLLEIDGFAESEAVWFTTNKALKITVKYPDDDKIQSQQLNYIKTFTQNFETVLFSSNFKDPVAGYRNMVDTTSLINWYIASELTGNPDAFWSTYLYKKRDIDKFFFGPLWDYDIAFNNDNRLGDAVHSLMREKAHNPRTWIQRMWQDDWFKSAVNRRWQELVNDQQVLEQLIDYVDETAQLLNSSQQRNFNKWKILNTRVYLEQFLFSNYRGGIDYLKTYLMQRVDFLTTSFANSQPEDPSQPFVAERFYYRILNKGTNNAMDVTDESISPFAKLLMWAPRESDYGQQWEIKSLDDNQIFQIINRNSGLAITGNGRGNNLMQTVADETNKAQQWKITAVFTGDIYGLENVKSSYSANNSGGSFANGTPVIEYDNAIFSEEKINQHWYIQKIEKIKDDDTAIHSVINNSKIRIYPNPVQEYLRIEYNAGASGLPVRLFSTDGKCIYAATTGKDSSGCIEIRRQDLDIRPGIYVISVGEYRGKLVVK